jgi:hypothetical protein
MKFSAVDVPHPRGLEFESAFAALSVFVAAPTCAAVVVTELDVERDPGGSLTARQVHGPVKALGGRN